MEIISQTVLDAAGQWWIYPLLLVFFFVDGFAMVVPNETLIVALAAFSRQSGEPKLWILGVTALLGAIAGNNLAYLLGRKSAWSGGGGYVNRRSGSVWLGTIRAGEAPRRAGHEGAEPDADPTAWPRWLLRPSMGFLRDLRCWPWLKLFHGWCSFRQ